MTASRTRAGDSVETQCLQQLFADCFEHSYRTCLAGGAAEPLYQPADASHPLHTIYYREDFFASALHEVAHWCIAGRQRRQRVDFGYWYAPDGRSPAQQAAFESVETKPQALEYFFTRASGRSFRVSIDNIEAGQDTRPDGQFREAIYRQCLGYQRSGLPTRAATFYRALAAQFGAVADPGQLLVERVDFER